MTDVDGSSDGRRQDNRPEKAERNVKRNVAVSAASSQTLTTRRNGVPSGRGDPDRVCLSFPETR